MVAENYFVSVASGTVFGVGSHAVNMTVLCGLSGTNVIPIQVNSAGQLVTSGA